MGREIIFPQVCEKGKPGGGGWTRSASLQRDTEGCSHVSLARSDGPIAPPERPDLVISSFVIYQGLEKASLPNSHWVMLSCTLL